MTIASDADLLRTAVAGFSTLPPGALGSLAAQADHVSYASGQVIVHEGDAGNHLYIIADGQAEVTMRSPDGPLIMAVLGPRESFGEIALLSTEHRRTATITALTPVRCYVLSGLHVEALLAKHPDARVHLAAAAELATVAGVLKRATPFASLDTVRIRALAARLTAHTVPAGAVIMQRGAVGESCYILRQGQADVVLEPTGPVVATLDAGALFGEAALLTTAPRNATVRAVTPCTLLALRRDDLLAVMGTDRGARARMIELLRLRGRPRHRAGVEIQHQQSADGTPLVVLKDAHRHRYYRLSPHGWFLWQHLDGRHSLRELTLAFLTEFRIFAPHVVAEILGGLSAAGFLEEAPLTRDVHALLTRVPWWDRLARGIHRMAHAHALCGHVDPGLTWIYRRIGRWVYTRPLQGMLAIMTPIGLALLCTTPRPAFVAPIGWPGWLAMAVIAIVIHEAGHAFTVKCFGRAVLGIGIGLHWGLPIVFVDTSDMWIAPRWPRIAVSLAGPYANLVTGSIAALLSAAIPPPWATWAWSFAALSYGLAAISCLPLVGADGHYALCDYLERSRVMSSRA